MWTMQMRRTWSKLGVDASSGTQLGPYLGIGLASLGQTRCAGGVAQVGIHRGAVGVGAAR